MLRRSKPTGREVLHPRGRGRASIPRRRPVARQDGQVGDGITPGEESIEEGLERLRRASAEPRPAEQQSEPRPSIIGPEDPPAPLEPTAVWTGSGVRRSPGWPGTDAVLLPGFSPQIAWSRILGGGVASFITFQMARWIGFGWWGLLLVVPAALWLGSGILRVRSAPGERAWADHGGLHVVERGAERVVPWAELVGVEAEQRSSGKNQRGRVVLRLVDGTRVTPRMWDGVALKPVRTTVDRILAARAGFVRGSAPDTSGS